MCEKMLEIAPQCTEAMYLLAENYSKLHELDKVAQMYDSLLVIENYSSKIALLSMDLSIQLGHISAALNDLKKAALVNQETAENVHVKLHIGSLEILNQNLSEAELIFKSLVILS